MKRAIVWAAVAPAAFAAACAFPAFRAAPAVPAIPSAAPPADSLDAWLTDTRAWDPHRPPATMPAEYDCLTGRSVFMKGGQAVSSPGGPVVDASAAQAAAAAVPPPPPPPAPLIFDGVIVANGHTDALLENVAASRVTAVHEGDAVAQGRVTRITLDDLDLESDGRVMRVPVGKTLADGVDVTADALTKPQAAARP